MKPKLPKIKQKHGRPRGENALMSMRDCSVKMGYPIAVLEMFRAAGCPAFKTNGYIYKDELLTWVKENPGAVPKSASGIMMKLEWEAKDKQAVAEIREHKLAVMRRDVIPVKEVRLQLTRTCQETKRRLLEGFRTFSMELALHCALSEEQIAWAIAKGEQRSRDILIGISKHDWCSFKCPKCGEEIK